MKWRSTFFPSQDWKDENCTTLDGNLETAQKKTQYDFIPPAAPVHRVVLYCSSEDCIEKFSITVEGMLSVMARFSTCSRKRYEHFNLFHVL